MKCTPYPALPFAFSLFFSISYSPVAQAQCPQIEAIMIDACGPESVNEFVIIHSGGGFNTADIQLDFDQNNNILGPNNNDINIDNGNWPANPTPCGLITGNTGAFTGCSNLIAVGPGVNIPPNSIVVLQTSAGSSPGLYNFASICGGGQCVYVISSSCVRTAGAFTNGTSSGTRTTNFYIAGSCGQTITYDLGATGGGNGAYFLPLSGAYGNAGCTAPPITSPAPFPPTINPIANVSVCDSYTLPPITGTNLSPGAAYYTGSNGTGTQYTPGAIITSTTTLYAFDGAGSCSDQEQFTITITPTPTVNQPVDVVACAGQAVNIPLTGSPGATFPWANNNPATGLSASGTGTINFTAAAVTSPQTALIAITPTQGSCTGAPVTFNITINPGPMVDDPANQTVCAGAAVSVPFTGTGSNPAYNWTNNNPAIGLPASGSGNISFTAAGVASTQTGTVTVTPVENGCSGTPQTFTITVNPLPSVNQPANINACAAQPVGVNFTGSGGATFSWANSNTAIGLGASGTGNISFITAAVATQQVATIQVTPANATCTGTPVSFTITVNPAPTVNDPPDITVCPGEPVNVSFAGTGANPAYAWANSNPAIGLAAGGAGNINFTAAAVASVQTGIVTVTPSENGCPGPAQTFSITINPTPSVNQPADVVVCTGQAVTTNFSGTTGAVFNWTNTNTAIGLGASGAGNISFTATAVATQQIATITVTPVFGACMGTPRTFSITVNPSPSMNDPADQTVCAGTAVNVTFSSAAGNPTYAWTNNNPAIGLAASGTGNINFTAAVVAGTQIATITVTPAENGCPGQPQTFTITVNPTPTVNQPGNLVLCGGQSIVINLSGSAGATLNWTNSNTAIGLAASGSGNINLTAAAVTAPELGTITLTPVAGPCSGVQVSFTITVNPTPSADDPANQSVCSGDAVSVAFSGTGNPAFNWTNNNPAIGLAASGAGNISFAAANVGTPQTATVSVTPTANGCNGPAQTFTIMVSPLPVVTQPANVSACAGQAVNVNFTGSTGATFSWTNDNPGIGLPGSGTGNINFTTAAVNNPELANITVTPTSAGGACTGVPVTFTITVNPAPVLDDPADLSVCSGDGINVSFSSAGNNPTYSWTNSNPAIGLPGIGTGNINFTAANVAVVQTGAITVTAIENGCSSPAQTFTVSVSPAPAANIPANVSVCNGEQVIVNFTGTAGATYSWTNNNPAIGLPASGTGNLNFTTPAVAGTETATITLTPAIGACTGAPVQFTITVSPGVSVNNPGNQSVCTGTPVSVTFTGAGNPLYSWTNSNPAIGLPGSGTGNINFTAANLAFPQTAIITVTPLGAGCAGAAQTFSITVNPAPIVNQPASLEVCTSEQVPVQFTGSAGAVFNWTNNNPAIGLPASGSGNLNFSATTPGSVQTAVITVTPTAGPCAGTPVSFSITVRPGVSMDDPGDHAACTGDSVHVVFTGTGNPTYLWTNDNPAIGLAASGTGDLHFQAANVMTTEIATIAVTPQAAAGHAYITNNTSNTVSMVELGTNTIAATIPVANSPIGVSVNPDGSRVYISHESNIVSVIDAASNTVLTTVSVGGNPFGLVVSPDGSKVYVTNGTVNNIAVIDAATNTVSATIPLGAITRGITCHPDGARLYAAMGNNVHVINTITNTLITSIPHPLRNTYGLRVLPDGSRIYVACSNSNDVSVIDATTNAIIANIPVGNAPSGVAISPDGSRVYVANENGSSVSVIDPATNTVLATVPVGTSGLAGPIGISVTPDGKFIYVANILEDLVSVIDAATNTEIATIPTGISPIAFGNFITPNLACEGAPQSFTITVGPAPSLAQPNNVVVCGNVMTNVLFLPSPGATVQWTSDNPAIGLAASGNGNINFIAANVPAPQTATITATPVLGQCNGTPVNFTITVNPAAVGSISGDLLLCAGDSATLTASGGVSYEWDSGQLSASITVGPTVPTNYTAIITNTFGCPVAVSVLVDVSPAPIATISGNTVLCAGESSTLTASGAGAYLWNTMAASNSISVTPAVTTTFTVTVTNAFACTDTAQITIAVHQPDTINLAAVSCSPADTGMVVQMLQNQAGCDSIVTTVTSLAPSDSLAFTQYTCTPGGAGVFTYALVNQFGCDSIVVTTILFDPAAVDTTLLSRNTCDPTQAGISQASLTGADGCDSLVITTTTLIPPDSTFQTAATCDPALAGISTLQLTNQAGCDSIIITTTTLIPPDSTFQTAATCDPALAGISTLQLTNQAGCDSIIITTTTLIPPDSTFQTAATCDPALAGISTLQLTNQAGCDSIIITNTTLLPSDTVFLTQVTCDSSLAGIFLQPYFNQFGCDSTVFTTIIFDPNLIDISFQNGFTCDPSLAGTTQINLTGADGCDSLVVLTLILQPSDTLRVTSFTCIPSQAGVFVDVLPNQFGCDSVLISEVIFDPLACAPVVVATATNLTCGGSSSGSFSLQILNGQPPLQYSWAGSTGNLGAGPITNLGTPVVVNNLPAGNYSITVTNLNNQTSATATVSLLSPPVLVASVTVPTNFNGFSIRCYDTADGTADGSASGGTPPYQFAWNNGTTGSQLTGLAAGSYLLTVTDSNGCTALGTAALSAPPPLVFALALERTDCGDTLADATVFPSGGVAPYAVALDGNLISGTMPAIGAGMHTVTLSDSNGCSVDSALTLNLPPAPFISLPADTTVVLGHTIRITALTNLSTWSALTWQPLPDTACAGCLLQEWMPLQSQQITVTIVDAFGCSAQATILVGVSRVIELYVPNVFSPNEDGQNDLWNISAGPSVVELQEVQIFDRWGNLQYFWNSPLPPNQWPGWDGSTRGQKASPGVYTYYMEVKLADGRTEVVKGDVTVMGK
ncbi:MAG: gliding motility-associated C-terminal domain-containing protein [Saprospirales bacterium]|nr:gliding motility-associated C-terminal domain-containing protein [Saprospirales bacterium]